jgi:hypothetical protein
MSPEPAADHSLNRRRFTQDEVQGLTGESAASRALFAWYAPGFSDRLGDRLNLFDNTDGPPLELLRLRQEFSRVADFEFSLRARVGELRDFDHPRFARVCRADRLPEPGGGLALVSVRSDGIRLSDVLRLAEGRGARLAADLLLPLVADAADAVGALHAQGTHVVHGVLGTDRLVVAPGGRLLIAEYVLGSALRGLPYSRADFWRTLRVALPAEPAAPAFDQRTDVLQLGMIALSLALSRPLDADDDLQRLPALLDEAERRTPGAGWDGRWPAFRGWLGRALLLEPAAFPDAREAAAVLSRIVPPAVRHASSMRGGGWDQFVADCEAPPILTGPGAARAALGPGREAERQDAAARPVSTADPGALLDDWERSLTAAASATPSTPPSAPETDPAPASEHREWHPPRRPVGYASWRAWPVAVIAAVALATLSGIFIGARFFSTPSEPGETGSLAVESSPPGAMVSVNGTDIGPTPVTLTLPPGAHVIELVAGTRRRALPVTIAAGARLSQFVEMPPPVSATGSLRVTTQPAGLRVLVDGAVRGTSPLVVPDLATGPHLVTVEGRGRTARQNVDVTSGATASLFVPLAGGNAPAPGWLSVAGDIEFQVYENGELLGTSRSARIMLPAGRHEVELVNEDLGVRATEEVQVPIGGTASVEVDLPRGRMDVNALPWAEVWLDGERVGETPLGNVPARVGRHVVTFRHPQLGERRVECVVAVGRPTRVGVDLRK